MPASLAHALHANRVLDELHSSDDPHITDKTAFFWGAQGPDFLYTHRYLPWQSGESLAPYGEAIQAAAPALVLPAMLAYWQEEPDDSVLSYLYGFVCHFSLDSAAHPFVNACAARLHEVDPSQTAEVWHHEEESALDTILLRRECGKLPVEVSIKNLLPRDEAVQRKIADLYAWLLEQSFRRRDTEELCFEATCDARAAMAWMNDRTGLKRRLLRTLEGKGPHRYSCHLRPLSEEGDFDYANVQREPWAPQRSDSFFDIYDAAIEQAAARIRVLLRVENWPAFTGNLNFLGEKILPI